MRPTSFNTKLQTKTVPMPESFPTPMEEPRKVMRALFLGAVQVDRPCGIDVIHGAIDQLMDAVPKSEWKPVTVAVAPSTVTINFEDPNEATLDCRVRFLSFLGIGENVSNCAFIMHTAQDTFVAHVLQAEPNAGPLCKTIEAACKLRYQKCLDARPAPLRAQQDQQSSENRSNRASIGAALKNMLGSRVNRFLLTSPPAAMSGQQPS